MHNDLFPSRPSRASVPHLGIQNGAFRRGLFWLQRARRGARQSNGTGSVPKCRRFDVDWDDVFDHVIPAAPATDADIEFLQNGVLAPLTPEEISDVVAVQRNPFPIRCVEPTSPSILQSGRCRGGSSLRRSSTCFDGRTEGTSPTARENSVSSERIRVESIF